MVKKRSMPLLIVENNIKPMMDLKLKSELNIISMSRLHGFPLETTNMYRKKSLILRHLVAKKIVMKMMNIKFTMFITSMRRLPFENG